MNRTKDNILGHDGDALLSEKNIRPLNFKKKLSESDSVRPCLVTGTKKTLKKKRLRFPDYRAVYDERNVLKRERERKLEK